MNAQSVMTLMLMMVQLHQNYYSSSKNNLKIRNKMSGFVGEEVLILFVDY